MARRIRLALSLFLVSFALTAAACSDAATGPTLNAQGPVCDTSNPYTCR